MEAWQKEYIRENGPQLINEIDCNVELTRHLTKCNVLANIDVDKLNVEGNKNGQTSKSDLLLQLLTTRINGYKVLAQTLYHCKQSGPFVTLLYGVQLNVLNCNPFKFCNIVLNPDDILSKNVLFQGVLLPLKDICAAINSVALYGIISENMDASTYQQFMNNDAVVVAKDTIPDKKPYYIPRTLCMRSQLNPSIFQETTNGVFLFEGMKLAQLSQLTKSLNLPKGHQPISVESSRTQIYGVTSRFIVLDHHKDYDAIVNKSRLLNENTRKQIGLSSSQPTIYWIQCVEGNYHYVKCSGGPSNVKNYILSKNLVYISQDQFVQHMIAFSTPTVFYDSPGMGKTILLAEFARCIKSIDPSSLVVFLRLSEVIEKLVSDIDSTICLNSDILKSFLINWVAANAFGRTIMTHLIDSKNYKVHLFLDGFDEIDDKHIKLAKLFLKCASEIDGFKIALATRPHYSNDLENLFGVQGYRILAFQLDDQVSFFLKFWESEYNVTATDELKTFAKSCIESFNKNISSDERQITGIPLQCRMLAEIYATEAERGGNLVQIQYKLNSIYDMYDSYVTLILSQFCTDTDRDQVYENHVKAAFKLIFPNIMKQSSCNTPVEESLNNNQVYKMGIMEAGQHLDASTPTFVHRTFAEFLCAKFVGTSLCKNASACIFDIPLATTLMNGILKLEDVDDSKSVEISFDSWWEQWHLNRNKVNYNPFENFVPVQFLNQFLDQKLSLINNVGLHEIVAGQSDCDVNEFYIVLGSSLHCNMLNVFILVLGMYVFSKRVNLQALVNELELKRLLNEMQSVELYFKNDLINILLDIAAKKSSIQLLKLVCSLSEVVSKKSFHICGILDDLLKSAASRGNYQIFEFLLNCRGFANLNVFALLKRCLENSYNDIPEQIEDKCEILQLILLVCQQSANALSKNPYDYIPVMLVPEIHPKLIDLLLKNKVNPTEVNFRNENVAHLTARFYSSEEYNEFVKIVLLNDFAKVFETKNHEEKTPLHVALEKLDITPETWQLLVEKCNLNLSNDTHSSLLSHAVVSRRNGMVIKNIETVGKIDKQSRYDDFVYLSAEKYNLEAMKYFVGAGGNVNKRHTLGLNTVLGRAIAAEEQSVEMVQYLVENQIDVNAPFLTSCYGREDNEYPLCCSFCILNPLQLAKKIEKSRVQDLLLSSGAKQHAIRNCFLNSCLNVLLLPCNFIRFCCICSCMCVWFPFHYISEKYGWDTMDSACERCSEPPIICCMSPCECHIVQYLECKNFLE